MDPGLVFLGERADREADAAVRANFFPVGHALDGIFEVGFVTRIVPRTANFPGRIIIKAQSTGGAGFRALLAAFAEFHDAGIDRFIGRYGQVSQNEESTHHRSEFGRDHTVQARHFTQACQNTKSGRNTQRVGCRTTQAHITHRAQEFLHGCLYHGMAFVSQAGGLLAQGSGRAAHRLFRHLDGEHHRILGSIRNKTLGFSFRRLSVIREDQFLAIRVK